jgi:hypothetical protein
MYFLSSPYDVIIILVYFYTCERSGKLRGLCKLFMAKYDLIVVI